MKACAICRKPFHPINDFHRACKPHCARVLMRQDDEARKEREDAAKVAELHRAVFQPTSGRSAPMSTIGEALAVAKRNVRAMKEGAS